MYIKGENVMANKPGKSMAYSQPYFEVTCMVIKGHKPAMILQPTVKRLQYVPIWKNNCYNYNNKCLLLIVKTTNVYF